MSWKSLTEKLKELGAEYRINYQGKYDGRRVTSAKITYKDKEFTSSADCSFKEQFNKKKGRLIALGRAYKRLKEESK